MKEEIFMEEFEKMLKESQDVSFRKEVDQMLEKIKEEGIEWNPSLRHRIKIKWMFFKARFLR